MIPNKFGSLSSLTITLNRPHQPTIIYQLTSPFLHDEAYSLAIFHIAPENHHEKSEN